MKQRTMLDLQIEQALDPFDKQAYESAEWSDWECPNCEHEHSDPGFIFNTSCACGAIVILIHGPSGHADAKLEFMGEAITS